MKALARSATALAFLLVTLLLGASALTSKAVNAADILNRIDNAGTLQLSSAPKSLGAGPYVGLGIGTDIHAVDAGVEVDASIDGAMFTGRLGYDIALRKHLLLGAFGDVNYSTAGAGDVDADYSYQLGGRAGLRLGGTLLYGMGGYAWNDFSGVDYQPTGYFAGGGLQTDLGDGFSLAIEGQREWSEDGVGGEDVEQTADRIRLMLLKKM